MIPTETSSFYGSWGEKYHNSYSFEVNPVGDPPAFVISGDSATWKYPSGGGTPGFVGY